MVRSLSVLTLGVAAAMTLAGPAGAQSAEERDFIESIVPGMRALRELADKTDEKLEKFRRLLGGTSGREGPDGRAVPAPEPLEPLPDPREQERMRQEFLHERNRLAGEQFQLVERTRRNLRTYVSHSLDRCRERIAAGSESGSRSFCEIAEKKIDECKQRVEPEINRMAERLTARYRSRRDGDVAFTRIDCGTVFKDLDDPGRLLRRADLRLEDSSCYLHIDRAVGFVKTGAVKSILGANDASVPAYLSYIGRMCPERIAEQAKFAVDEAAKAKANLLAAEASALELPSRGRTAGTTLLQGSINQAEQEKNDPSVRQAREREERERIERNRQAGVEAEERVNERIAAMGQVLGQIAQLGQGGGGESIAGIVSGAQGPPSAAKPPSPAIPPAVRPAQLPAHQPTYASAPPPVQPQAPQRKPQTQEDRYYSPLACARVSSKPSGNASVPCMQNNCGRSIEAHHNGGMWSVGAGQCYAQFASTVFYAACEKNDAYDRGRNQCKR